jgi:hypothetical protein
MIIDSIKEHMRQEIRMGRGDKPFACFLTVAEIRQFLQETGKYLTDEKVVEGYLALDDEQLAKTVKEGRWRMHNVPIRLKV